MADSQTRTLIHEAITMDLLGPDVLLGPDEPAAPEGYELIRRLGRGGAGEVHLAHDKRLDRQVAIKFLAHASPADIERFRREARFTARLANPSIVQVYELGDHGGQPYIAMQVVQGSNLADADLDTLGVVRCVREIAEALRHAHREGIVHRDIKPENILVDRDGRAYLTDFGIARSLDGTLGETISRQGQIMGTPALMPPEQARGDIEAVDARSDIYALGATLFTKLTGRYPFVGDNVVDVLHAVIHERPALLRSYNASVPRGLEAIVVKCMQKAREDRYASVDELIADIDRFLVGEPVGRESNAWFRRLVHELHDTPEPEAADDPGADPYWTVGIEIVRDLAAWDADLYRVTGSLTRSFKRLDAIRARLDEILAGRPDIAWARFYRGVAQLRRGRLGAAREDMERAIDRVRNISSAYFELGRVYIALFLAEYRLARGHVTPDGFRHDLAGARGRLDQAVVAFSEAQRLGGDVPAWISDCTGAVTRLAESDFAGCVAACDRILADEPDLETVWKLRGDAQRLAGDEPFGSYDRAIDIRRTYFEALYAKADAHLERNELEAARAALERAIEIHPEFADAVALLARTHLEEARADGSVAPLGPALEHAEAALRLDDRNYDATLLLAEARLELGRLQQRDEPLASALAVLDAAGDLQGCRNRVMLLAARTRIERARLARARGEDPTPELRRVLQACNADGRVGDGLWDAIRRDAEALITGC